MNKLIDAGFIEARVLPVVIAFGLGVIASAVAHDAERELVHAAAVAKIKEARRSAMACEQILDATAPVLTALQEVRP